MCVLCPTPSYPVLSLPNVLLPVSHPDPGVVPATRMEVQSKCPAAGESGCPAVWCGLLPPAEYMQHDELEQHVVREGTGRTYTNVATVYTYSM